MLCAKLWSQRINENRRLELAQHFIRLDGNIKFVISGLGAKRGSPRD